MNQRSRSLDWVLIIGSGLLTAASLLIGPDPQTLSSIAVLATLALFLLTASFRYALDARSHWRRDLPFALLSTVTVATLARLTGGLSSAVLPAQYLLLLAVASAASFRIALLTALVSGGWYLVAVTSGWSLTSML